MDQRLTAGAGTRGHTLEPAYVERFSSSSRLAHWLLAAPLLLLLLTGLTNFVPRLKALQVADARLFAWLHVLLGFASLAAMVLLVVMLLPRRTVRADLRALARWGRDDYLWLQHTAFVLAGLRSRAPPVGKFNAGQKLNALASLAATSALMASGLVIGVNFLSKDVFGVRFVQDVFRWHTALSLLVLPLVLGHLYLVLLHPSTRESLRGMTLGVVRRDWARRHHDAWTALDAPPPPSHERTSPPPR